MVLLCKDMKWDYYTYLRQPDWFLDLIRTVSNLQASHEQRVARKINNRRK